MDLRETILSAVDLKSESVTVPEWGGITVNVCTMNGHERAEWLDIAVNEDGTMKPMHQSALLVCCLKDQAGGRIFTAADVPALHAKNGATLSTLYIIARDLNGLSAKQAEDAEKN